MASKGESTGAQNTERDRKSIEIRRAKKKAKKATGKGNEQGGFSFERKVRKNRKDAEKGMPVQFETPTNRKFSVRAWDKNGDEVWSDDEILLEKFYKDWSFLQTWALRAKHGEIYQTSNRNLPLNAEFFFRRIA